MNRLASTFLRLKSPLLRTLSSRSKSDGVPAANATSATINKTEPDGEEGQISLSVPAAAPRTLETIRYLRWFYGSGIDAFEENADIFNTATDADVHNFMNLTLRTLVNEEIEIHERQIIEIASREQKFKSDDKASASLREKINSLKECGESELKEAPKNSELFEASLQAVRQQIAELVKTEQKLRNALTENAEIEEGKNEQRRREVAKYWINQLDQEMLKVKVQCYRSCLRIDEYPRQVSGYTCELNLLKKVKEKFQLE